MHAIDEFEHLQIIINSYKGKDLSEDGNHLNASYQELNGEKEVDAILQKRTEEILQTEVVRGEESSNILRQYH
jgi:hypothetical protein